MKPFIKYLFALAVFIATPAYAADEIYADKNGIANKGYDVVAYFSLEPGADAVKGSPDITTEHDGYTYHFSSSLNKQKFEENPQAYLPQYGGYCAFAVSNSQSKAKIDPDAWTITDGKLYLNYNKSIHKRWGKDIADHIARADEVWPTIKADEFKKGWF